MMSGAATELMHRDNPPMMQARGRLCFGIEPSNFRFVGQHSTADHLDRDHPIQFVLLGKIDNAHPAATNHFQQHVVAKVITASVGPGSPFARLASASVAAGSPPDSSPMARCDAIVSAPGVCTTRLVSASR